MTDDERDLMLLRVADAVCLLLEGETYDRESLARYYGNGERNRGLLSEGERRHRLHHAVDDMRALVRELHHRRNYPKTSPYDLGALGRRGIRVRP